MDGSEPHEKLPPDPMGGTGERPFILGWIAVALIAATIMALGYYFSVKKVPYLPSFVGVAWSMFIWTIIDRGRQVRERRRRKKRDS